MPIVQQKGSIDGELTCAQKEFLLWGSPLIDSTRRELEALRKWALSREGRVAWRRHRTRLLPEWRADCDSLCWAERHLDATNRRKGEENVHS